MLPSTAKAMKIGTILMISSPRENGFHATYPDECHDESAMFTKRVSCIFNQHCLIGRASHDEFISKVS
jgi:hypothetical protein